MCVYLYVHTYAYMTRYTCMWRSKDNFPYSVLWVPENKLRMSGLMMHTSIHWVVSLILADYIWIVSSPAGHKFPPFALWICLLWSILCKSLSTFKAQFILVTHTDFFSSFLLYNPPPTKIRDSFLQHHDSCWGFNSLKFLLMFLSEWQFGSKYKEFITKLKF